jgi:plastocyanin
MRRVLIFLCMTAAVAHAAPTGTIAGKVAFTGTPPVMPELARFTKSGKPRDPACATHEPARWLVVDGGGVEDALVRLAVGSAPAPASAAPVVIDQRNCLYVPRVVGIVAGQKLVFRNSDPTAHNVHTPDLNWLQARGAKELVVDVSARPGDEPVHVTCDVHPWMEAWVVVTDHPYFAVTGPGGSFTLDNVPPGTYTLEVWHPNLGRKTAKVTVAAGKTATARIPAFQASDYKGQ